MDKVSKKVFCFDIDGTLCTNTDGDYGDARPIAERIETLGRLWDQGHIIKLFTARGTTTGKDWSSVTERQMSDWGVKYHELIFGKPFFDILVDDKAHHSDDFFDDAFDWNW
jgi:ribonucleotide monophosphatase NagD (HAD superfamily)